MRYNCAGPGVPARCTHRISRVSLSHLPITSMKWAAAALLALSAVRAGAPPVSINLQTSWGAPPILLEILSVQSRSVVSGRLQVCLHI